MADAYQDLATDIAGEPELVWKAWTEARDRGVAGGVYLFRTEEAARSYAAMHAERLREWGVTDIDVRSYDVNQPLSEVTRAWHRPTSETV